MTRMKEILKVLMQHDIVKGMTPEKLRVILEDLGPTFVKLGQIMSMRPDILPSEYCDELTKLRVDVRPMEFKTVCSILEAEYHMPMDRMFERVDEIPLGSASIAQAHSAILKNGKKVVVKVQRENIYDTMSMDITLLKKASKMSRLARSINTVVDFNTVLDEMWFVAKQEMDFVTEAQNADEFFEQNKDVVYVTCPHIYHEHTTPKVLVMEYMDGIPIDDIEQLKEAGYDLTDIAAKLADNYVKQLVDDGFFHADPHPGNLRIREGQIVWLDLGMMGRISSREQKLFRRAILAIAEHNIEEIQTVILELGIQKGKVNHAQFYGAIDDMLSKYGTMGIGNIHLGSMMEEVITLAGKFHIAMPKGITMFARGILTIEGVVCALNPDANIVEIMSSHLGNEFLHNIDFKKEGTDLAKYLYRSGKHGIQIPFQISECLRMALKGHAKLNLELVGSEEPLSQIDKMINRIVVCVLTASLLIGSSLICTTNMNPKILGIPFLGFFGYFISFLLCLWLIFVIHTPKK